MGGIKSLEHREQLFDLIGKIADANDQNKQLLLTKDGDVRVKTKGESRAFTLNRAVRGLRWAERELHKNNQKIVAKFVDELDRYIESKYDKNDQVYARQKLQSWLQKGSNIDVQRTELGLLGELRNNGAKTIDPALLLTAFQQLDLQLDEKVQKHRVKESEKLDQLAIEVLNCDPAVFNTDELITQSADLRKREAELEKMLATTSEAGVDGPQSLPQQLAKLVALCKDDDDISLEISDQIDALKEKIANATNALKINQQALGKVKDVVDSNLKKVAEIEAQLAINEQNILGENKVPGIYHLQLTPDRKVQFIRGLENLVKPTDAVGRSIDPNLGLADQYLTDLNRQKTRFIDQQGRVTDSKPESDLEKASKPLKEFSRSDLEAKALSCIVNQAPSLELWKQIAMNAIVPNQTVAFSNGSDKLTTLDHSVKRLENDNVKYQFTLSFPLAGLSSNSGFIMMEPWTNDYPANEKEFGYQLRASFELDVNALAKGELKIVQFEGVEGLLNFKPAADQDHGVI